MSAVRAQYRGGLLDISAGGMPPNADCTRITNADVLISALFSNVHDRGGSRAVAARRLELKGHPNHMTQVEQIRAQVQQVLDRAQADSSYYEQLKNNPEATLIAAGVPAEATPDLIAELASEDEVSGYMRCDRYTCFFDITLSTCGCWTIGGTS